ncbi:uncharacterized protein LOC119574277 [Penaeus monodon]|uniref:uncharacterized protein LOC119574277 n=1 Tax=Penaeus monodon TaxID=6687 RepID=UPI0018A6F17D|nr:uncharacterized protein LOC119574277 [Penaeus monodon]
MFTKSGISFTFTILVHQLTLFSVSSENIITSCCYISSSNEDLIFNCSCSQGNDMLIIEDSRVSCGENHFFIPNTTTQWNVGECGDVHLSGSALAQLPYLHSLHLHDIDQIHLAPDFLNQYSTHLKSLRISHAKFSAPEVSLDIHAQKLESIALEHLTLEGDFSVLLQTQDTHHLSNLFLKYCNIENLGEINLSTRYVENFSLEHNTIKIIHSSAVFQDSSYITFLGNKIDKLQFLAIDSDVYNFTFVENEVNYIALESMVVNNSTIVSVTKNSFYHIEQFGFTWLQPRMQGSLIFSSNHFQEFMPGTLLFYYSVHNKNLQIKNNMFHMGHCDCDSHQLIRQMTDANNDTFSSFYKERMDIYSLFIESSYCIDNTGKKHNLTEICKLPESGLSFFLITLGILIISALLIICVVIKMYKNRCRERHKHKEAYNSTLINLITVSSDEDE